MREVLINDVTVRDGNQSLLATRMDMADILKLLTKLDKVGFHALEVWGGATFDSAFRFLHNNAWDNLRAIKKACPNTKISMLLRGQNLVGYRHYDNDTLERFIKLAVKNGMDIIRCFDALNDPNNVKNAFKFIKKYGAEVQAAIAYTVSPVHNNEYYCNLVKRYVEMGADSICLKDMAGILSPKTAFDLVSSLKKVTNLPINLHTHATANTSSLVIEQAILAGVDIVDGCLSPFSGGTAHLADETILEIVKLSNCTSSISTAALNEAYLEANKLADKYIKTGDYRTRALIPNPQILTYQVPGGMLTNLISQLEQQKAANRLQEVLQEVPRVRADLGYPPLVTPLSQMVGTQAVLNVLLGERYKMAPKEIKDYCQGFYGQAPSVIDEEVKAKILKGVLIKQPVAIDDMPTAFQAAEKELSQALQREVSEEEVVSYIIFPNQVLDYLKNRQAETLYEQRQVKQTQVKLASKEPNMPKVNLDTEETVTFNMYLPKE